MTINYQFGDVDAHGALIRAQAASLESEHQAIVRDVLAAGDFWGGAGSVACQEFITQLGRNVQVIYEQANQHGQKVQSAGNNMASTDSAVGSSWACHPKPQAPPAGTGRLDALAHAPKDRRRATTQLGGGLPRPAVIVHDELLRY